MPHKGYTQTIEHRKNLALAKTLDDNNRYLINKLTGCWEMKSKPLSKTGYVIKYVLGSDSSKKGRKSELAHRYFYEKYKGKIPEGLIIDHLCRNRICVNPEHLEAVTYAENNHRGDSSKLNWNKVEKIKELYKTGLNQYQIAKKFKIHQGEVSRVINGLRWGEQAYANN